MIIHKPINLEELKNIQSTIRIDGWSPYLAFFRGQGSDWPIKPGISRDDKISSIDILKKEEKLFTDFRNSNDEDIKLQKHFNRVEYEFAQTWMDLFQAQHLQLKTRLTDWTQDFDHALLFTSYDKEQKHLDENGVIYIFKCPDALLINFNKEEELEKLNINPFDLDKFYLIKHFSQFDDDYFETLGEIRRFRQDGSFIISPSHRIKAALEKVDYLNRNMEKIIISPNLKKQIREDYLVEDLGDYLFDIQGRVKSDKANRISGKIEQLNLKHFG